MSNDNKYSNNVRVVEELKKISDASDQKKQAIKGTEFVNIIENNRND